MKLQIVSKLVRKNSQTKQNTLSYSILPINTYNQQYYPERYIKQQNSKLNVMVNKKDHFVDFFDKFEQSCTVFYSKKVNKEESFKKRLQPQLIKLQEIDLSKSQKSSIEFSFKKKDRSYFNDKNTTLQTEASQTITRSKELHSRTSSKGRLRKFNSLLTLKCEQQQNTISNIIQAFGVKNSSVCKQTYFNLSKVQKQNSIICSNRLSYKPTTSRTNIQSLQAKSPFLMQKYIKTQLYGDDIKQRLSRIRKQLNLIYEEKKQPQFKLKLF